MGYRHFQVGCVIVKYYFCNTTTFMQNCIYAFSYKFDTVLYQFLKTRTSDRCLIGIVKFLRFSGFRLYPFFSFTVPLNEMFWQLWMKLQVYISHKYLISPSAVVFLVSLITPSHSHNQILFKIWFMFHIQGILTFVSKSGKIKVL